MKTKFLLSLLVSLMTLTASAYDFILNGIAYNIVISNGKYTVAVTYSSDYNNNKSGGSLTIPERVTYKNVIYTVTAIEDNAFNSCNGFYSTLTIPNSVTSIGKKAFQWCSCFSIIKVLSNQPANASSDAFLYMGAILEVPSGCINTYRNAPEWSAFKQITDKDVTVFNNNNLHYTINEDGNTVTLAGAVDKKSLELLEIPETVDYNGKSYAVTVIRDYAFSWNKIKGSLTIPNSITDIGEGAFYWCSSLNGTLTIGNSVTSIGDDAFYNCANFKGWLIIPNSVITIGNRSFGSCFSFNGMLTIGNSVTSIGSYAFEGCSGFISSLYIPNSVTSIGERAFGRCSNLTAITLPNSVTSIGSYAFTQCSSLASITIPTSVTSIGDGAFSDCSDLTSVRYNAINCSSPTSKTKAWFNGSPVSSLKIGDMVKTIPDYLAYDLTDLTSITISNSVTSIGELAFENTPWYNNQPDGIVYAGLVAYKYKGDMPNDTQISLKEGTKGIASSAFHSCSNLTNITIPNTVTTIGNRAFYRCIGLKGSLSIPNSVTSIGESAFQNCSGFTGTLTIPNSVTSIGESAFQNCSGFTGTLTIPNSVTSIGAYAFSSCIGFTGTLTIPNSVTSINGRAFYGCTGLKDVNCFIINVTPDVSKNNIFSNETYQNATLHVYKRSENAYRNATGWKNFTNIVGDNGKPIDIVTGDVDGDGKVDVADINTIINVILENETAATYNGRADVNGDGKVDVADINSIIDIILGQ